VWGEVSSIEFSSSLGGPSGISFEIITNNYLYHNNLKQKMKRRSWAFKRNTTEIEDPSVLFPKKTLDKIFSGKKKGVFKKKDMIESLDKELNAKINQNGKEVDAWIPITPDTTLLLFRNLILKIAAWEANGLYIKEGNYNRKKANPLLFKPLPETADTINFLKHTVSLMKKKKTRDEMATLFNTEIEKYYKKVEMERK
jgi:hypothetical protein